METARIFTNGGSQAVRLPKNCRFDDDEILINRIGNVVIMMPKGDRWSSMMLGLSMFTDDFLKDEIEDPPNKKEEGV